jgi:hypothetical protein
MCVFAGKMEDITKTPGREKQKPGRNPVFYCLKTACVIKEKFIATKFTPVLSVGTGS